MRIGFSKYLLPRPKILILWTRINVGHKQMVSTSYIPGIYGQNQRKMMPTTGFREPTKKSREFQQTSTVSHIYIKITKKYPKPPAAPQSLSDFEPTGYNLGYGNHFLHLDLMTSPPWSLHQSIDFNSFLNIGGATILRGMLEVYTSQKSCK